MTLRAELAIIGGGPAGLAAAITAARRGVAVALVDMADMPGGATALHPHHYPGTQYPGTDIGPRLWAAAIAAGVTLLPRTAAWGLFEDDTLALATDYGTATERMETLHADAVLLATGAIDRYPPFAGDTIPGVMTATTALTAIVRWGVRPGTAALVVGAGAEAIAVADALRGAGMTVATIPTGDGLRAEAGPDGALVAAHRQGESFSVDALVLAVAREPSCALAQMRDCPLTYDIAGGGYVPMHDATMHTAIWLLSVAGDAAGVRDAGTAMAQGQTAAHAIADRLGKPVVAVSLPLTIPPGVFRPMFPTTLANTTDPAANRAWLDDDTLIACRCEGVTVAEVRAAIRAGAHTPGDVKRRTRVGNGTCQGRWCGDNIAQLVSTATGQPMVALTPMNARAPVVPVSLGALADAAALTAIISNGDL